MNTKKLAFYILASILGGCIPVMSLHPLFTEKTIAFDEKLLGTWVDANETTWQFSDADKPEKAYKLTFKETKTDKEGKSSFAAHFVAHLVKLENRLFLDVYHNEPDEKDPNKTKWPYNTLLLIPAHTFIKINAIEPQLKLKLTDDDELKKLLEKDPNAVEHTLLDEDRLVLTASTQKLQAFVLKYADDDRVFSNEVVLNRKNPKEPQESVEQKHNEPNSTDPNKS